MSFGTGGTLPAAPVRWEGVEELPQRSSALQSSTRAALARDAVRQARSDEIAPYVHASLRGQSLELARSTASSTRELLQMRATTSEMVHGLEDLRLQTSTIRNQTAERIHVERARGVTGSLAPTSMRRLRREEAASGLLHPPPRPMRSPSNRASRPLDYSDYSTGSSWAGDGNMFQRLAHAVEPSSAQAGRRPCSAKLLCDVSDCAICLQEMESSARAAVSGGDSVLVLCCGHVLHKQCLTTWLLCARSHSAYSCPVCKAALAREDLDACGARGRSNG